LAHNIATLQDLCEQAEQWQDLRNQAQTTVNWRFTTADARIKLKRLYPVLNVTKPIKRRRRSVTNSVRQSSHIECKASIGVLLLIKERGQFTPTFLLMTVFP